MNHWLFWPFEFQMFACSFVSSSTQVIYFVFSLILIDLECLCKCTFEGLMMANLLIAFCHWTTSQLVQHTHIKHHICDFRYFKNQIAFFFFIRAFTLHMGFSCCWCCYINSFRPRLVWHWQWTSLPRSIKSQCTAWLWIDGDFVSISISKWIQKKNKRISCATIGLDRQSTAVMRDRHGLPFCITMAFWWIHT